MVDALDQIAQALFNLALWAAYSSAMPSLSEEFPHVISNLNLPHFSLKPISLVLSLSAQVKYWSSPCLQAHKFDFTHKFEFTRS